MADRASTSATPAAATAPPVPPTPVVTTAAPTATPTVGPVDPLTPQPGLESAPPPGLPTCRAANLSVVDADALTTATATQEVFALRTSGPDCQLQGWPTVQFRDAGGRILAVQVRHGGFGIPAGSPKVTTLSRSTSASFVVATGRSGKCLEVATVVVGLPDVSTPERTSTTMSVCSGAAGVSPIGRRADVETG